MRSNWRDQALKLAAHPYFIKVALDETTDGQPIYFAHVIELEGCFGQGETPEAAVTDLQAAMVDFIESLLEDGLPVPAPAELAITTSSSTSKTFTISNQRKESENVPNPYKNIFVPAN